MTTTTSIEDLAASLRLAAIDADQVGTRTLLPKFRAAIYDIVRTQDRKQLERVAACIAGVAAALGKSDEGTMTSQRLRELGSLVHSMLVTSLPLEQIAIMRSQSLGGRLLYELCNRPGRMLSRLATLLGVSSAAVSMEVTKLERAGLLHWIETGDREDADLLYPTPTGLGLFDLYIKGDNEKKDSAWRDVSVNQGNGKAQKTDPGNNLRFTQHNQTKRGRANTLVAVMPEATTWH